MCSARCSGNVSLSTAIASPLAAADPVTVTFDNASLASSRSFVSLAITRTAASCWYSAVASSSRVRANCSLRLYASSASESHSFWKEASKAGMEVRVGGRGRTMRADLMGRRSSTSSSSPDTGSLPFSSMYFSISRFSKTAPIASELDASSNGAFASWTNLTSWRQRGPQELRPILETATLAAVHLVNSMRQRLTCAEHIC